MNKEKIKILFLCHGNICRSPLAEYIMNDKINVCLINDSFSLGASGAIFGLMGCLLYFGYHYRVYLSGVIKTQIIPIIILIIVATITAPAEISFAIPTILLYLL